jgi:hypothetical protein
MRLRVGLLLCLFATLAVVGCRKPLAPNVDRNKAPETWITAAPFDTITLEPGPRPPLPNTIPVRFHVYWAGADQDGAVVGFYWAVVETLAIAPEGGSVPPLPGPRPRDYRYTTRTDTTFIFTVAEDVPDRQHAFYLYAVDNQGKADPTPARFIFNANDRFPPVAVFDEASATGTVYYFDSQGVLRSEIRTVAITDTVDVPPDAGRAPADTVPSNSRLTFRFHGEVRIAGSIIKGFRYKLDESELQPPDPDSLFQGNKIEYHVPQDQRYPARNGADTIALASGTKVFTLRAVDQANGNRIPDPTRRFQMNFSPDTWFAGPDPDVPVSGPWHQKENGDKYALFDNQGQLPAGGLPGSILGPDSVLIMPVHRPAHRTFFEVYRDTIFLRKEFDTVHMSSWVIFYNGGFDTDSPYLVKVADGVADILGPRFPGGPVLTKGPVNGSPIGFRSRVTNFLTPNGPVSSTAQTSLYPFYDPNDVFHFPRIGAYHPMFLSGKAYALQRAEDGDGARDGRVLGGDERTVGENNNHPYRPLVLVFFVNFPPALDTGHLLFRPSVSRVDTFYQALSPTLNMYLPADDPDPYRSGDPVGGPSGEENLRMRFRVTGTDTKGQPFTFRDPPADGVQQRYINVTEVNLDIPEQLATGPITINVELCDCSFCELNPGEGRCVSRDIQAYYVKAPPGPAAARPSRPGLD